MASRRGGIAKKANKSPFALFVLKMSAEDQRLLRKPLSERLDYCDHFYRNIDSQQKSKFESLSQMVRQKGLNEYEILEAIKQTFNLGENRVMDSDITTNGLILKPIKEEVLNDYQRVKSAIESVEDIKSVSIVVISFNVLLKTFDKYIANEIGLTKFSLKDGIQQTYHRLIANAIPSGYYSVAKEHSKATHGIPIDGLGNELFAQNLSVICEEFHEFLYSSQLIDSKNKKLIFYKLDSSCESNRSAETDQIQGCIDWIRSSAQNDSQKDFSVFEFADMTELLFVLTHPLTQRPKVLMSDDLSDFGFDFRPKTNCDFHEDIGNRFCALGVTKRLVYLFFKSCLPLLDIEWKASHKPEEVVIEPSVIKTIEFNDHSIHRTPGILPPNYCPLGIGRGRGQLWRKVRQRNNN